MRTLRGIAGLGLLAAIVSGVVYYRCSPRPARHTNSNSDSIRAATLTDEQKDRIRKFWSAYRKADDLKRKGRFAPAIAEYRQALGFDPDHEGSLYNLANCYIELDRFVEALPPLRKLIAVNPLSQRGHLQIGLVLSCPAAGDVFDLTAAEKSLQRAFEINQEETGSLLRLAGVEIVKGNEARAVELYTLANQSNVRALEGYYVRAYVHWKSGRGDAARDLLQEAVRQSGEPKIVAGAPSQPGEGDTRPGSELPPSTIEQKRLIKPFWTGLAARFGGKRMEATDLDIEFSGLRASLRELRRRAGSVQR